MDSKRDDEAGPVMTNAASGKQLRAAKKRVRSRKERDKRDLLTILDLPEGRRVIWRYLDFCNINKTTFSESSNLMAFKSGMQNVGQRILADIVTVSPEAYLLMMQENREDNR